METTIKDQVKNIFKTNAFGTALELTRNLRGEYINEYGVKSWNAMASYYRNANIQPETKQVSEPDPKYTETTPTVKKEEPEKYQTKGMSITPLMKQYEVMKKKHPDAILLFRVGDFYETFGKDAVEASEVLGITLTRRMNGKAGFIELAGFPHHALDSYLPKLVRAGKRVAICEQLDDPKKVKVTEKVIPNTDQKCLFDEQPANVQVEDQKEADDNKEPDVEKIEYMLYRNIGDKVDWFGHRENFYGLKVGDSARMIRMNNKGVSEGLVVASNALTLDEVAIFHRCYGVIIRMKRTYKEQLDLASECLNKIPDVSESGKNYPTNDIKLTDFVLNFGK